MNIEVENTSPGAEEQVSQPAEAEQPATTPQSAESVVDLDSAAKVKFGGKEYTPSQFKEWQSGYMRQQDYTKKTQDVAQESKYWTNLGADLDKVKGNPQLVEQFKQIYPQKFHSYLKTMGLETPPVTKVEGLPDDVAKRFLDVESKLQRQEQAAQQREVAALEQKLEVIGETMTKKYPFASEQEALSVAEMLAAGGQELDQKAWEEVYKTIHSRNEQLAMGQIQAKQKTQTVANKKARDTSAGGGIPGQAPANYRSIKEATEAYLKAND